MLVDQIEPSLGEVIIVSYDGEFGADSGSYEGTGTAVMDNDCKYEGQFRNGMFHGKGVFTWPRGVRFEGDFEAGQILGKGSYEWSDGSIYVGDVRCGLRHGFGKFTGSSSQVYEGEWAGGKRHGKGKIWYNEDRTIVYTGDWLCNLRHGYGSMKYASGNSYEGEWLDDKKSGTGLMVWRDVDEVYTGRWLNDQPHGLGEHIWGDSASHSVRKETCNIYRGNFVEGRREGSGAFFYMNGSMYTGEWLADLKHGEGIFVYADGRIFGGLFHQNRMITDFAKEEASAPRATEAVNPQFKLHISDLFDTYPHLLNSSVTTNTASSPPKQSVVNISSLPTVKVTQTSVDQAAAEVKEMERLLLKYNHYLRNAYRRYTDFANKRRLGEALRAHQLLAAWSPQDTLHRLHKTCATARIFQKRFFCMNLEQMLRFLRESGVVGPFFRSYDLTQCLEQMRAELEMSSVHKLREYTGARRQFQLGGSVETKNERDEEGEEGGEERMAELQKYMELQVPTLMDGYLHPQARLPAAFQALSCQPLLEREFVELFVRALAVKYVRAKGVNVRYSEEAAAVAGMSLTQLLYYVLAHKLLPLVSDFEEQVPPFYREFYFEEVQTLLYSNEASPAQTGGNTLDEPLQPTTSTASGADGTNSAPVLDASSGETSLTFFEKLWMYLKRVDSKNGRPRYEETQTVDVAETILCGQPLGAFHAAGPPALNDIPSGGSVPLYVLLDFLLAQRGDAVSSEATEFSLLMAMECAPPSYTAPNPLPPAPVAGPAGEVSTEATESAVPEDSLPQPSSEPEAPKHNPLDFDLTCVQSRIDFHDCLELICRLVSSPSNVWVLTPAPPTAQTNANVEGAEEHGEPIGRSLSGNVITTGAVAVDNDDADSVSVYSVGIADILSERIGFWKQTFDVKKFLI